MTTETRLTVLEGWRDEEARVELLSFFSEVQSAASAIQTLEAQADMPSLRVIQIAGQIGRRAYLARTEYLHLTGHGPRAA